MATIRRKVKSRVYSTRRFIFKFNYIFLYFFHKCRNRCPTIYINSTLNALHIFVRFYASNFAWFVGVLLGNWLKIGVKLCEHLRVNCGGRYGEVNGRLGQTSCVINMILRTVMFRFSYEKLSLNLTFTN